MTFRFRTNNIYLLKLQFVSEAGLAKELWGITDDGRSKVQTMASRGVRPDEARVIEEKLDLPQGWFDRDNLRYAALHSDDYQLLGRVLAASATKKAQISALLDSNS